MKPVQNNNLLVCCWDTVHGMFAMMVRLMKLLTGQHITHFELWTPILRDIMMTTVQGGGDLFGSTTTSR